MTFFQDLGNLWNNIKEIDLHPLAEAAQYPLKIALVGRDTLALHSLASNMGRDPLRPDQTADTPLALLDLNHAHEAQQADLIVLLLPATLADDAWERALAQAWSKARKALLVLLYAQDDSPPPALLSRWTDREKRRVVFGGLDDLHFLLNAFVPAVLKLLPEHHLALGRQFPLFRSGVAQRLISDTCLSNAAYALSSGLAEVVPLFNLPLNLADMVVLSKAQAFLVYKLGLALGLSTHWQDYLSEFGGVLGGGFFWRQIARQLVGLIPAWGLIPKVAVAYAGTYVVGQIVLRWYLNGRHISAQQVRQLYGQALSQGKRLARSLISRLPAPRSRHIHAPTPQPLALPAAEGQTCPQCGKVSAADANFCQYCSQALGQD